MNSISSFPIATGRALVMAMIAALLANTASADVTARVHAQDIDGQHQIDVTLESQQAAAGRKTRFDIDGSGYMIFRDGKAYVVTNIGMPVVVDMSTIAESGGNDQASATSMGAKEIADVVSLESTGGTESVAGIAGEVYTMVWRDGDGREYTDELVLSDDARALELTQAWSHMNSVMAQVGLGSPGQAEFIALLEAEGMGWLRIGDQSRVTSLQQTEIYADRFDLPATVIDLPSGAETAVSVEAQPAEVDAQEDTGGFFGKLFGDKARRQTERQQERADSRVDQETDSVVDSVVDKAFDKLFGD